MLSQRLCPSAVMPPSEGPTLCLLACAGLSAPELELVSRSSFCFLFNPPICPFKFSLLFIHTVPPKLIKMSQICDFSRLQSPNSHLSGNTCGFSPECQALGLKHNPPLNTAIGMATAYSFLHPLQPPVPSRVFRDCQAIGCPALGTSVHIFISSLHHYYRSSL